MIRFDFARNAYDFGMVPPDSIYHPGKVGDINPFDPARRPSSDIIYCTTGSSTLDPVDPVCGVAYNPNVYDTSKKYLYGTGSSISYTARRNLWYTFLVKEGGNIRVQVVNRTAGANKAFLPRFSVYKSNVDGSLPFSTVVNTGQVDSTLAQGLTLVGTNYGYYCYGTSYEVGFYRDPCSAVQERYYILVENPNAYPYEYSGVQPNVQYDVLIQVDSVTAVKPKFDHYYQASNMGNLGAGTYTGATDNYSCATRDAPDPVYAYNASTCGKTLWYKFTSTVTGVVRYRVMINNQSNYSYYYIQLFRQNIAGDSTVTGLQINNTSNSTFYDASIGQYWAQTCVSPGTYYILLPGCTQVNEYAYPIVQIVEQAGDFCSTPVNAPLNGPGTNVSSVIVNCHTIGTDYGEFNPLLTCPNGANRGDYKTSWFKINITGADTLDVTTFLTENTNAVPADIKYRLMNGNCGAMQERSCVQDAQTQDTYKCLAPGEYFIQVFTPVLKKGVTVTGNIDLHLSAVKHADTCAPPPACLANATFIPEYNCTTSDSVTFVNYSTYGSAIHYTWDFGYAGQTSTAVAPKFKYPELATDQTYTVTLTIQNTGCAGANTATATAQVLVPGRPKVNLGNDTVLCNLNANLLLNATTWTGATYLWQNGSVNPTFNVTSPGTYYVRVTYNNCIKRDTIVVKINNITPLNQTKTFCGSDSVLLSSLRNQSETHLWNTGATSSSIYASATGTYTNNINWLGCNIRDSFKVYKAEGPFAKTDTTVCAPFQTFALNGTVGGATGYQWQNGSTSPTFNVTTPGLYWVKVNFPSCNVTDSIQVKVAAPAIINSMTAAICSGQSYTLPRGPTVTASGTYADTIKNSTGCDIIRTSVVLSAQAVANNSINAAICAGQNYTLPWGTVVNTAGVYRDTLHYISGCDSIRRTVNVTVNAVNATTTSATICAGQTYTLASGTIVNSTGIYSDTLRYIAGCDSVRRTVNLVVQSSAAIATNASICPGQTYTLPWGTIVNATGIYRDTLHYSTGCDSVRRTVNLTVQTAIVSSNTASICTGQNYTLPWGTVVNTAGIYNDTLRYLSGCDSIRRTVTLLVNAATTVNSTANICAGQNYTLPWGTVVSTAGTYSDTLHYVAGCDSVRRSIILTVQNPSSTTTNASICSGQTYTLPWGMVVNAAGVYRDTLHYATGCDSVRRAVNLTVQTFATATSNTNICAGQSYTLPWGAIVNAAGVYRDTLHYVSGCDSVRRFVTVAVQSPAAQNSSTTICAGQSYTLPWGQVVSSAGTYRDTLHYLTGCDSIRRAVTVTVKPVLSQNNSVNICSGLAYTLPWGIVVNTSGTYYDTIHYVSGCDSLRRAVDLTVQTLTTQISNTSICDGQNYTLPWGQVVSTAGTFTNVQKYASGCDSLRRTVILTVQTATDVNTTVSICQGSGYTLPWGQVVTAAGTYNDVLHYISGCDSVKRAVTVTVQNANDNSSSVSICSGKTYMLPWGQVVSMAGIYRDTLHYATGCDSIRTAISLTVTAAAVKTTTAAICSDQTYTLPWGTTVNASGNYSDTLRSISGCDSMIRNINLTVNIKPTIRISKANDVNCVLFTTRLNVSGAGSYVWEPASSLSNPFVPNPIASPTKTTMYTVTATAANGCITKDSIQVKMVIGNPENGYLVPNSFTPNNDGLNDCFGVPHWGAVTGFDLTIYNRYGETVFHTTDPGNCWDGIYKGKPQNAAAYVYQIKANGICGPVYRKGAVVLIR